MEGDVVMVVVFARGEERLDGGLGRRGSGGGVA